MTDELEIKQNNSILNLSNTKMNRANFGMLENLAKLLNTGRGMVLYQ